MASPPFSLNTSAPANTDIAANFPTLDRSDKDVIQSWFLVQQNDLGHNVDLLLDQVGSANGLGSDPTPSAGTAAIYYDTTTVLMEYRGDVASAIQLSVPIGAILDFAGSTAPNGYLLCYGQAVSRSTYAVLFDLISTTYGSGDGSTTFNLPDLRGRQAIGLDNMGGTPASRVAAATALNTASGAEEQTILQANIPLYNLTVTDPGHKHNPLSPATNFLGDGGSGAPGGTTTGGKIPTTAIATTGITVSSAGSGTALETMDPWLCMNKIIRAL